MRLPPSLQPWDRLIREWCLRRGIDPFVGYGLVRFESGGQDYVVSPAGAVGLWQVMPSDGTSPQIDWRLFAGRPTTDALKDPVVNTDWGTRILAGYHARWGTVEQALANFLGAIDAQGNITGRDPFTGVTGNEYVDAILILAAEYRVMNITEEMLPLAGCQPRDPYLGGHYYLKRTPDGVWHPGADFNAPGGPEADYRKLVYARFSGVIRHVGWHVTSTGRGFGWHVWGEADHGVGWPHFCHMDEKPAVMVGDRVGWDTPLGLCGRTAGWPNAHLHYEVKRTAPLDWGFWPSGLSYATVAALYHDPLQWLYDHALESEREEDDEMALTTEEREALAKLREFAWNAASITHAIEQIGALNAALGEQRGVNTQLGIELQHVQELKTRIEHELTERAGKAEAKLVELEQLVAQLQAQTEALPAILGGKGQLVIETSRGPVSLSLGAAPLPALRAEDDLLPRRDG